MHSSNQFKWTALYLIQRQFSTSILTLPLSEWLRECQGSMNFENFYSQKFVHI